MNAKRTLNIAGNYDPISKRLTVVTFDTDPKATYLNQEWNPDKDPLTGMHSMHITTDRWKMEVSWGHFSNWKAVLLQPFYNLENHFPTNTTYTILWEKRLISPASQRVYWG